MAAEGKAIKGSEVVESGFLNPAIKQFDDLIERLHESDKLMAKVAETSRKMLNKPMSTSTAKELAATEKAINDVNKAYLEAQSIQAREIEIQTRLAKAQRLSTDETERQAKSIKNQSNAYKELSDRTRDLKNESKRLGAEMIALEESGKGATTEYKKLERQYKETTREASKLDKQLKKLDSNVGDNFRKVGMYEKALSGLRGMVVRVAAAFGLMETIRFVAGREVQLQRLQLALKNVTDSTNQYNKAIRYTRELSDKYGQDLLVITDTYKSFIASSKTSGLALGGLNKIYESVIKSSSALGLSTDQTQGALLSINQMFSKGTVQAEELRGQLAERLPQAFDLMAKGLGVTTRELNKMLQKGEVLAVDALPKLAEQLEKTYGASAQKNIETVGGAWNRLKNVISESVNDFNNANGITQKLASGINFLADNFTTIIKSVYELGKAFLIYKGVQATLKLRENYDLWRKYGQAVKESGEATGEAAKKGKAFGNALKGIGITLLITALTELALKFWDVASGAEAAREQHEALQKSINEGTEYGSKYVKVLIEALEAEKQQLELAKSKGKISQTEYDKEIKRLNNLAKVKLQFQIQEYQNDYKIAKQRAQQAASEIKALREQGISDNNDLITRRFARIDVAKRSMAESQAIINELRQTYKDIDSDIIRNQIQINENTKNQRDIIRQVNTEIESVHLNLENIADLQGARKRLQFDEQVRAAKDAVDAEMTEQLRLASETGQIKTDLLDELINKEQDMKRKAREQQFIDDVASEKRKADEDFTNAKKELKEKRDEQLKQGELTVSEQRQLKRLEIKEKKTMEDLARIEELKQSKLTAKDREEIEKKYQIELEKLNEERVRQSEITGNKIAILELEKNKDLSELDQQRLDDLRSRNNELIDAQIDYYEKKNELDKKDKDKQKELWKQVGDLAKTGMKVILDERIRVNERLIQMYEDERNAAQNNFNYLQKLAENGNIKADESLADQQAKIDAATEKKIAAQKRIERLKQVETAYNIALKNIETISPPSKAIAKTGVDIATLQALMAGVRGFHSGTNTTVADAFGNPLIPGTDGYLIRAHGNEKILDPTNSQKTGGMTTDQIADVSYKWRTGQLVDEKPVYTMKQVDNTQHLIETNRKLEQLTRVIENKPEYGFGIDEVVREGFTLVSRVKQGNLTQTKRDKFLLP